MREVELYTWPCEAKITSKQMVTMEIKGDTDNFQTSRLVGVRGVMKFLSLFKYFE